MAALLVRCKCREEWHAGSRLSRRLQGGWSAVVKAALGHALLACVLLKIPACEVFMRDKKSLRFFRKKFAKRASVNYKSNNFLGFLGPRSIKRLEACVASKIHEPPEFWVTMRNLCWLSHKQIMLLRPYFAISQERPHTLTIGVF